MKTTYTLLLFLLATVSILAQAPEKMSYQAVLRDASNTLLTNQEVGMQISILQTTITGTAVYIETQTATTNINGLVSLEIGTGSTSDNFATIDWSAGPYFIKSATDPSGGGSYTITGTSQIMSVPFALYAKTSGNSEANATNIISNTTDIETNTTAITTNTAKVGYTDALVSGNTDVAANTAKVGITSDQASEITANTAKTGVTSDQSTAITTNTAKVGYTDALVSGNTDVAANTAKVGITTAQASEITTNNAKTGITADQASDITANTAKVGYTEALVSGNTAVAANTSKDGITEAQASAITDNTDKVGITEDQATAITDNTDKVGITSAQASEITANTLKVDTDATSVNAAGALMDSELTDLAGIKAVTISTLQVIPSEGAFVDGDKTKLDRIAALESRIAAIELLTPATVGDFRTGGVVFWVDPADNTHGLVCAIEDQSGGIHWYNGSDTTTGATGTAIGTGSANTTAIIADQGAVETAYAAGLARAYRGGGYTDWFLPSKNALNKMYQNKATINTTASENGGADFPNSFSYYWSSTEVDSGSVWLQYFSNGDQFYIDKSSTFFVRAVRAF